QQTRWPGRLEVVAHKPLIIMDGAHNKEGMEALVNSLTRVITVETRVSLLVGALADKPLSQMAAILRGIQSQVETIALTTFDFPRAA
ncbi:hypothetical protein MXD63_45165, partial [Frankia sp. Cpl3]|nr:hypothetical protein [Frankia sp. Cpl3]